MIWWKWVTIIWGIKTILKNREVKRMFRSIVKNALNLVAGILRMPFVDFKWDVEKYRSTFAKLDTFRKDGKFTDEEMGEVLEELGENQPRLVKTALYAAGGMLKSRLIDFEWDVSNYKQVFDKLNDMRTDNFFEDEELADFCVVLAETL